MRLEAGIGKNCRWNEKGHDQRLNLVKGKIKPLQGFTCSADNDFSFWKQLVHALTYSTTSYKLHFVQREVATHLNNYLFLCLYMFHFQFSYLLICLFT